MTGPPSAWMTRRAACLALGPALGLTVMALAGSLFPDLSPAGARVLGATLWIAIWWVTEPIPIPVTSLMPAVLFPLFLIESGKNVAGFYANHLILLLLGGFLIARSIEIWGLHRRIALTVLSWVGESPRQLVVGFVVSAAFLSMWISNTATTLMLIPIGLSVVSRMDETLSEKDSRSLALCMLLGIAYGANIGGTGTLIGTPPNLIFAEFQPQIDFMRWLSFGAPVVVIFVPVLCFLLVRVLIPLPATSSGRGREVIRAERRKLGPLRGAERRVAIAFAVAAGLWIFKGNQTVAGWSWLLSDRVLGHLPGDFAIGIPFEQLNSYITDSLVALVMAAVLFLLPSGEEPRRPLLTWKEVETVPWGMLLLFGGGFAIAGAFKSSGLSVWLGSIMAGWLELPDGLLTVCLAAMVSFTTEVTSNTASTAILMPILDGAASSADIPSVRLMLPAVISVSFAFMLPVATAPNAIVFATGRVPIRRMVMTGFWLNLVGVCVVYLVVSFIAPLVGLL